MPAGMIEISIPDAQNELRQLGSWLRAEEGLRGRVQLSEAPPLPGQMGGTLESLVVVATSGTATAFCNGLFSWLKHRRDASKVDLKVKSPKGEELVLSCGSADDADQILRALRNVLGEGV
ncbi:hypothetical protein [Amycolatopsis sp. WQ 127309]|uniref:effector-associated constant component EACC1 n=1 Tax=Amycolatopsis sp. WQ 127309 TaxID=2932773 RepID=UPI001FF10A84|nr:hypothetical protein [Amycolatopsis sp. WQ 127309]UOZ09043.1 hypothetical protein MUY22_12500 [Amycolatopsis sp. WQ 127309]